MSELDILERAALAQCELIIARGLRSFVEVGTALVEIRRERLYRESHGTFEDYCRERWGFSRVRAHQLIEGAETTQALTIVNSPLPANEGQARELTGLEPEQAAEVMQTAAQAPGAMTAAKIREAREQSTAATLPPLPQRGPVVITQRDEADARRWLNAARAVHTLRSIMGDVSTWMAGFTERRDLDYDQELQDGLGLACLLEARDKLDRLIDWSRNNGQS